MGTLWLFIDGGLDSARHVWRITIASTYTLQLICFMYKYILIPNKRKIKWKSTSQSFKQNANAHCVLNRSSIYSVWRKKENQIKLKDEEKKKVKKKKTYDFSSFKGFYVISIQEHSKTVVPRIRTTRPNGLFFFFFFLQSHSFHFDYYEIDSVNISVKRWKQNEKYLFRFEPKLGHIWQNV